MFNSISTTESLRSEPGGVEASEFFKGREGYLLRPRGQLTRDNLDLFDGLRPQDFLNHFVDFGSDDGILAREAVEEDKWYKREDTKEAKNVNTWLSRMAVLQQIHRGLLATREKRDGSDDLEADNSRLEMSEGKKVIWDYRVELPEED
jgi:hypothetical protein